jgi:hypothetical protein
MSEYRAAEHVRWAVEAGGVVILDRAGQATTLGYPPAAIWDFLTRGESEERISAKLCAIASLDAEAAQALTRETVAALRAAGWIAPRDSSG